MTAPRTQPGERFSAAVAFAADVHREQSRKGTAVPYLTHLLGVAALTLEDGGDEDEAIAGLLHDAAEDGGGDMRRMLDRISAEFGERVAAIVEACTDVHVGAAGADSDRSAATWRSRKRHTIDALAAADPAAARVMLADKLHNLRSTLSDLAECGPGVWRRFNAGPHDQLWYYGELARTARTRHPASRLGRELDRAVAQLRDALR